MSEDKKLSAPTPDKRILLCVSGLSPQIITETLYALLMRDGAKYSPHEIKVITTTRGKELIEHNLIDPEGPRHLEKLLADFSMSEKISFSKEDIHVIKDHDGHLLDDIRTREDNECAADMIASIVRSLCNNDNCRIHASIAGGRKTMGFYLGYAMSLYARQQDELSHVLVNHPFEAHRDFYYPPKAAVMLKWSDGHQAQLISTDKASITLAPIPIVRMRDQLPPELQSENSFSKAVELAQRSFEPPRLEIDLEQRTIRCSGQNVELAPAPLALLAWMADRVSRGLGGVIRKQVDDHQDDLLKWRARVSGAHSGSTEAMEHSMARGGFTASDFDTLKSRLNKKLDQQLGRELARYYRIDLEDGKRSSPFTMAVAPERIEFCSIPNVK